MADRRPPRRPRSSGGADPAGTATRRAALRLIDAILRRGDPLDIAMHAATQGLTATDRAFAVAIVSETLRWMVDLDALIDGATAQILPDDVKSRAVLRIALAQLLVLKSPGHAVVSTALPLVDGGPRRLVHAILSRAQQEEWQLPDRATLPLPTAERWAEQWGLPMVEAAEAAWSAPPPIDLSFAAEPGTEEWPDAVSLAPRHRRLPRGQAVETMPGYREGGWWVQDLAASLPARLLGAGEGRTVLDLCAAPGGKTMQLAAAGWNVVAVDSSAKRLERLRANMERTGLSADIVQGDIRSWAPEDQADAVLLDAPCSATGIFRRHPDVLHRIEPRQIAEMAELQTELLSRAARWVKPGGTLIYATCSLEQAEGEDQVSTFLDRHAGWSIDPARADELPEAVVADDKGLIRTLPAMLADAGGLDGFFVARLRAPSG
ncbi:SAM-dependent methyltransferase [Sphingopyxis sp. H038]|uniref:RsmB/NOP family class I SAM-dependent RNA methyltransferase n=1 Tax=unclassified Sphingopyxis TaxID=2614943 RepID=UPI000731B378|nr:MULTISPECIES: RsmB/NOP family class I SAM-dependent RNA methyltransferase [unclassified Sphingopyxis]KTE02049.1 SAM-dependent methyltransferase [Sphingopyxis sp. H012]KTE09798.1 SAM-dependent methyltransferase [Sphingopyxis sp. H053]KTE15192.1 SAM-dependent methyltransferase [Sphingopyxis sp. H093]KTE29899.1 SAM-dependent methyltransferase [Sphingopyxis sp. H080]KTE32871.1 SAM-dependent methyltransferase [Sphingopyxis sp. H038]